MNFSLINRLVLLKQSVFAFPWVMSSTLLALCDPVIRNSLAIMDLRLFFWIPLAFISARSAGMAFNRWIDRKIDAANPRTQDRLLPKGEITKGQVLFFAWANIAIFVLSCAAINYLLFTLSPLIIALLYGYSYSKRFTSLAHFVLGVVQFFAPIFAWIAISGTLGMPPILLGLALFCSIAANDVIYSIQDLDFDAKFGLHSIPVKLGLEQTIILVRCLHTAAVVFLLLTGYSLALNWIWTIAIAFCAVSYLICHWRLRISDHESLNQQFSACNASVAILVLSGAIGEFLWAIMY